MSFDVDFGGDTTTGGTVGALDDDDDAPVVDVVGVV